MMCAGKRLVVAVAGGARRGWQQERGLAWKKQSREATEKNAGEVQMPVLRSKSIEAMKLRLLVEKEVALSKAMDKRSRALMNQKVTPEKDHETKLKFLIEQRDREVRFKRESMLLIEQANSKAATSDFKVVKEDFMALFEYHHSIKVQDLETLKSMDLSTDFMKTKSDFEKKLENLTLEDTSKAFSNCYRLVYPLQIRHWLEAQKHFDMIKSFCPSYTVETMVEEGKNLINEVNESIYNGKIELLADFVDPDLIQLLNTMTDEDGDLDKEVGLSDRVAYSVPDGGTNGIKIRDVGVCHVQAIPLVRGMESGIIAHITFHCFAEQQLSYYTIFDDHIMDTIGEYQMFLHVEKMFHSDSSKNSRGQVLFYARDSAHTYRSSFDMRMRLFPYLECIDFGLEPFILPL